MVDKWPTILAIFDAKLCQSLNIEIFILLFLRLGIIRLIIRLFVDPHSTITPFLLLRMEQLSPIIFHIQIITLININQVVCHHVIIAQILLKELI